MSDGELSAIADALEACVGGVYPERVPDRLRELDAIESASARKESDERAAYNQGFRDGCDASEREFRNRRFDEGR